MSSKNFEPQYLAPDGRKLPPQKSYPKSQLSEEAAKKVAKVLHIMLNDK